MKKTIIISVVVIIIAAAGYFWLFSGSSEGYTLRYDKVDRGDMSVYVTATGTLNAVTTVQVGTQVSGIISQLYADFNSIVKKGQIIARIDTTFLYQAVKDALASLDRAKAQFDQSKRAYDREKVLYDKKLDAQVDYDAALTNLESNKASLMQAQAQLDRAKINLAYATIYAPVNGVVIDRQVSMGQTVAASFSSPTLFTIANDLKKMQVETTVDESDIGRVSVGQEASFTVDAFPNETFTGKVSQIRLAPTVISNVVNYTVIIDVPNDRLQLMPGMTANVKILVAKVDNALKVPNMALRFQPPQDLIDTAKVNELRAKYREFGRGRRGGTIHSGESEAGKGSERGASFAGGERPFGGGSGFLPEGMTREKFRSIRDSLMKASGGKLSREEMMKKIREVFAKYSRTGKKNKSNYPGAEKASDENDVYGITNLYPQYEKSSYSPSEEKGFGRIWLLNKKGLLEPVMVRTGINDGRSTQILSNDVKDGEQLVIGASAKSDGSEQSAGNPFTGQRSRGDFRRGRF